MLYFCKTSTKCLFCKANCKAQQIKTRQVDDHVTKENEATTTTSLPVDPLEEREQSQLQNDQREEEGNSSKKYGADDCSCHKFPVQLLGSCVNQWENTEAFHENLKYVFLLREMLDYPKRKCIKYFKDKQVEGLHSENNDGIGEKIEENGWFSVCVDCTKIVEEGHLIYHEIEKLGVKLEGLKNNLSGLLIESQKEEETDEADDHQEDDEGKRSIFTEVREHFLPSEYNPIHFK